MMEHSLGSHSVSSWLGTTAGWLGTGGPLGRELCQELGHWEATETHSAQAGSRLGAAFAGCWE
jgi:hypothetical protein